MLQEEQKNPPEDFLDVLAQPSQQGPLGGLLTLPGHEDDEVVETVQLAAPGRVDDEVVETVQLAAPGRMDDEEVEAVQLAALPPSQPTGLFKSSFSPPTRPGKERDWGHPKPRQGRFAPCTPRLLNSPDQPTPDIAEFISEEVETVKLAALLPRTPWWRRRSIIFAPISLVIVILLIIVLPGILSAMVLLQFQTVPVTEGNLSRTVTASGPLQGVTYDINFIGSGKIAEIDVVVGQHVTQGQLLAKLDLTSLEDAVKHAQAAYQITLTALNGAIASSKATSGVGGANIAAVQTALDNAEANLAATETEGQTSVGVAQTALNNAEASLATAQQTAQATINAAQVAVNQACATPTPTPTAFTPLCGTAQAELQVAEANANDSVTKAQEAVSIAQSNLANEEATANENNVTAQAAVNAAQKALNTAIANSNLGNTTANVGIKNATSLAQAELINLNTAEHNLQNAILTAPHAGIVTVINGTIGGTPGVPVSVSTSTTGTSGTFIQIVDPSSNLLQVIADVNEANVTHLKVGDTVQFTVIAYGKREFTGVVSAISPNGTLVANMVSFPVTVNVDTNDLQGATLLPGMTATLKIKVVERVLLIPATAVSFAHTATSPIPANGGKPLITASAALMATTQAQMLLQQLLTQNPTIRADMPMATFVLVPSSTPGLAVATPVVLGLTDGNNNIEVLAGLTKGELVIVGVS